MSVSGGNGGSVCASTWYGNETSDCFELLKGTIRNGSDRMKTCGMGMGMWYGYGQIICFFKHSRVLWSGDGGVAGGLKILRIVEVPCCKYL